MNEALNIERHLRAEEHNSNHKLRQAAIKLNAKMLRGCRPDGDGWEEVWEETTTEEIHKSRAKVKLSRKQIAARKLIQVESRKEIKKVAMSKRLTEMRLAGVNTTKEELVQEIRDLWKIADPKRDQRPDKYLEEERKALAERFSERRTK